MAGGRGGALGRTRAFWGIGSHLRNPSNMRFRKPNDPENWFHAIQETTR